MLTYASGVKGMASAAATAVNVISGHDDAEQAVYVPPPVPGAHVCSRMLTYAHVCARMLTYAHVCSRMLTCTDAS
jgi:hypothetical protein